MLKLQAKIRQSKKADDIRQEGRIPAVVYGHGEENKVIDLDYQDVRKALETAGESTLIELAVEGQEPVTVLIHDIQYNNVSDTISHVDFYQIKKGEKINVDIELNYIGEAPAVRELGGVLVKAYDKISVECLPKDLVSHIDVDLSSLKTFDDSIKISDLNIPESLEIADVEAVVALINPPREEEPEETEEMPAEGGQEAPAEEAKGEEAEKTE